MKPLGAAYCCARAFVLAEFTASLQWQMVSGVQTWGNQRIWVEILITMVVFGGCFTIDIYLEKDLLKQNYLEQMTVKEVANWLYKHNCDEDAKDVLMEIIEAE
mgnify:CR=1 FL=1